MDGVRISGLWEKKDKNGETYYTGRLNNSNQVFVMKNGFKEKDEEPDFYLYFSPKKKR